jgi:hypothetical protein
MLAVNPGGLASMARFVRARASAYDDTDDDIGELMAASSQPAEPSRDHDGPGQDGSPEAPAELGSAAPGSGWTGPSPSRRGESPAAEVASVAGVGPQSDVEVAP